MSERPVKGRPPVLFPLFAGLESLPGIGPKIAATLGQMGIDNPRDLILTLPQNGIPRRRVDAIAVLNPPEVATLDLTVTRHQRPMARNRPWRIEMTDGQDALTLVYFHARPDWIAREFPLGEQRKISGKVELFDNHPQIVHPDHVLTLDAPDPPAFEPVYPLTAGLTSRQFRRALAAALADLPELGEWISGDVLAREGWPDWRRALQAAHDPQGRADLAATAPARARLAYDEFFAHQLTLALLRQTRRRRAGRPSIGDGRLQKQSLAAFSWPPTEAQKRAIAEIATDMAAPERMSRLLQGDVGSGKTLVAWLALMIAVEAGGQGVLMAPTEILARQHGESLAPLAAATGLRMAVLTGRDRPAARETMLEDLAAGRIDVLIGTHTVFQDKVRFADLRLAIIDEQHRFGVAQRMALGAKGEAPPDLLVMTATPIPRSLALAQYGDMDLSVLDEKPPGRKPVVTNALPLGRLDDVVDRLGARLAEGARAYWVCPLVEESAQSDLTAAEARFATLRARFGDQVRLIHGQMPAEERDRAMADFVAGEARILVATTVIEVGVNVPEATIMIIERAESFGLAQLHQLRGRVGRGAEAASCILLYRPPLGESAQRRLAVMRDTEDGFRIAEEDLAIRGAGDVIGVAQSGLPRFRIADLEHQAGLMQIARQDARALLEKDPQLLGDRGQAARVLLWFLGHDESVRLIRSG